MKIIFFGTSEFGLPALQKLFNAGFDILVITQPDQPVGRKQELMAPSIKIIAQKYKIPVLQSEKFISSVIPPTAVGGIQNLISQISSFKPQLGIVAAYGEIIPTTILNLFPKGILNIHPSLLPKYRGPSPIQTAILNQEKNTGVSIILLDEKIDHGPVLVQKEVAINKNDNYQILHNKLAGLGADLLMEILPQYLSGKIKPQPQNDNLATYTKIIKREDGQINRQNSASQIFAQFRAFYPWPGIYAYWDSKRLKIANLDVLGGNLDQNLPPGTVFSGPKSELLVKCGQGVIELKKIQLEGKKELTAREFLLGYKNIIGAILK